MQNVHTWTPVAFVLLLHRNKVTHVSPKRNTGPGAIVINMPVVNFASIIDLGWKYVKMYVNMYNLQNMPNNAKNIRNYEHEEYVINMCIYPALLRTA